MGLLVGTCNPAIVVAIVESVGVSCTVTGGEEYVHFVFGVFSGSEVCESEPHVAVTSKEHVVDVVANEFIFRTLESDVCKAGFGVDELPCLLTFVKVREGVVRRIGPAEVHNREGGSVEVVSGSLFRGINDIVSLAVSVNLNLICGIDERVDLRIAAD